MGLVLCPGCQNPEIRVEAGYVCFDCANPSPALRNHDATMWRWRLERATEELRDRFAMAALQGLIQNGMSPNASAEWAYVYADAMMEARKLPEPSPVPESSVADDR